MIRLFPFMAFAMTLAAVTLQAAQPVSSVSDIINRLDALPDYAAEARFTVSMPQLEDDVVYDLTLKQQRAYADTLMPIAYLIDWTLAGREHGMHGFASYFSGHHYRYGGERLQEYHTDWDAAPFRTVAGTQRVTPGVHRTAQFVNLLPAELSTELGRMMSDPDYLLIFHPDTVISGRHLAVAEAEMRICGNVAQEGEYAFDRITGEPVRIRLENNPGSISEQSISIDYAPFTDVDNVTPTTEEQLIRLYPDIFANMRESNFRIENLPGTRLPGFALLTSTGERYSRRTADGFRAPTIVALMDVGGGFSDDVVRDVRKAAERLPYPPDVIWAFTDNNVDMVEPVVGGLLPGEHLLMSATSLVRDCGVASLPTIILVEKDGTVANVILGYNKDLVSDVIQKMSLVRP